MGQEKTITPPQTVEEAIAQLQEVTAQLETAKAEAKKKDKLIEKLNSKLSQLEKAATSGDNRPVVEFDGKQYTVNSGARIGANVYSAKQIAEDAAIVESIMKIEDQQILTPVAETEEGE